MKKKSRPKFRASRSSAKPSAVDRSLLRALSIAGLLVAATLVLIGSITLVVVQKALNTTNLDLRRQASEDHYVSFTPQGVPSGGVTSATELLVYLQKRGLNATQVSRFHNGRWEVHVFGHPFADFELKAGQGYLVNFGEETSQSLYDGLDFNKVDELVYELSTGHTLVGFPSSVLAGGDSWTGQDICDAVADQGGQLRSISKWAESDWKEYKCGEEAANLSIDSKQAYFLTAKEYCTFKLPLAGQSQEKEQEEEQIDEEGGSDNDEQVTDQDANDDSDEDGDSESTDNNSAGSDDQTGDCTQNPPQQPVLLSVKRETADSVMLTWSKVALATHYSILYGTEPGKYQFGVPNTGNVQQFKIDHLQPGQSYYFVVKAVNQCEPSTSSNEVKVGGLTVLVSPTAIPEKKDVAGKMDRSDIEEVNDLDQVVPDEQTEQLIQANQNLAETQQSLVVYKLNYLLALSIVLIIAGLFILFVAIFYRRNKENERMDGGQAKSVAV